MKEQVSTRQMIYVLVLNRIGTIITIMSIIHMGPGNQDIWIMMILSTFYCLLFNLPFLFLSMRFSKSSIIGYMEKIFGKFIGKILGVAYGLFFMRIAILYYYIEIQMIRTTFMEELSPIIIVTVLMIVSIYIASRGFEVSVRTIEFFGPIVIGSIIFYIVLGFNNIDLTVLLPIYQDSSLASLSMGALEASLIFTDPVILSMNFPSLSNKKDAGKIIVISKIFSQLIIILMLIATQVSLGVEQARHSNFPFLTYVRLVRTYSIFERIEAVFLITWIIIVTTRVVSYLYISGKAFKEVFNKKDIKPFIYAVGIILGIIIYYISDVNPRLAYLYGRKTQEYYYYFIFNIGIPILAIITYYIRGRDFKKQERLGN
ncbi:MAG: GerAB/ArcD/ProY family transporter [Tissierellia bacterium]|nr:GerAB/ArcD/ProY family transporter [Tissierellia bacterium]